MFERSEKFHKGGFLFADITKELKLREPKDQEFRNIGEYIYRLIMVPGLYKENEIIENNLRMTGLLTRIPESFVKEVIEDLDPYMLSYEATTKLKN